VFFEHGDDWNVADEVILANRSQTTQQRLPASDKLMASAPSEVDYQYALWKGDFPLAIEKCRKVLTDLSGEDVKGYRAFWNYLCGSAAWLGAKGGNAGLATVAREQYKRAAAGTKSVRWLIDLTNLDATTDVGMTDDACIAALIEGLEARLESHGTANDRRFETEASTIIDGLQSNKSEAFENAHAKLGNFLGYFAEKPPGTAAPDSVWQLGTDFYLVFEDHDPAAADSLGANKIRQAASHRNWLTTTHEISRHAAVAIILVTPLEKIDESAVAHAVELLFWHLDDFRQWATKAVSVVREQRRTFPGAGDMGWRGSAITAYLDAGLDPGSIMKKLKQSPVKRLPVVSAKGS
jgi:hypothetical protein